MRSEDLSGRQVTILLIHVRRMSSYLFKLERRMIEKQFPQDEPLRVATMQARDKVQSLANLVHMLSCGDWGGRCVSSQLPEKPSESEPEQ